MRNKRWAHLFSLLFHIYRIRWFFPYLPKLPLIRSALYFIAAQTRFLPIILFDKSREASRMTELLGSFTLTGNGWDGFAKPTDLIQIILA